MCVCVSVDEECLVCVCVCVCVDGECLVYVCVCVCVCVDGECLVYVCNTAFFKSLPPCHSLCLPVTAIPNLGSH